MTRVTQRWTSQAGYSLTEMMIVLGLIGVLTGIAVARMDQARPGLKGDGGMRTVLSQMNQAREMAITQRRNMRITFTLGNKVTISKEDLSGGGTTEVQTVLMEGGVQFALAVPTDSPEGYGNSSAVLFPTATPAATPEVKFLPDGTLVNQVGAITNGTVFLAIPNMKMSARAVTVFGSTGRVRGYRWDGSRWITV